MAVDNIATLGIKVDPRKAIFGANKAKRAIRGVGSVARTVKNQIFSLQGALVGLGAGLALRSSLKYAMSIENLQVQLKFLTGSTEKANKAFKQMMEVAQSAPISLQEIQQASPALLTVAEDVDELTELLKMAGDIAQVSGLSFTDTALQMQRAFSSGIASAEMFREKAVGAMLGFEAGVSKTGKETKAIFKDLWENNKTTMVGAMEAGAETLKGQFSMLKDGWDKLQLAFMDAGAFDAVKRAVQSIKEDLESDKALQMAKDFGEAVADFIDGTIGMKEALFDMIATLDTSLMIFGRMPQTLGGVERAIKNTKDEIEELTGKLNDIEGEGVFNFLKNIAKDVTFDVNNKQYIKNLNKDLKELIVLRDKLISGTSDEIKNSDVNLNDIFDRRDKGLHIDLGSQTIKSFEWMSEQVENLHNGYRDLQPTLSSTGEEFKKISNHIDRNGVAFNDLADSIREAQLAEIVEDVTKSMEESITNSIMNIGQGVSSLKDMFKDLARIILRQFVQIQVAQPASSWLASNLNLGKLFTPFDGGGFTGAGARTGGVDNKGGFPAILHPNETVIDHTKGSQAGMGGNVNVSFNITANDTDGFDELLESRRGMIVNLINSAMNDRGTMGVV